MRGGMTPRVTFPQYALITFTSINEGPVLLLLPLGAAPIICDNDPSIRRHLSL